MEAPSRPPSHRATTTRCSFCGKAGEQVVKLIAGPGVYICNECVVLCTEILSAPSAKRLPKLDWSQTLDDRQMLEHLGRVARTSTQIDESLLMWVDKLRARGVTWARIGAAMGITRQSAWERFSADL